MADSEDKISAIDKIEGSEKSHKKSIEEIFEVETQPNKDKFDSLLAKQDPYEKTQPKVPQVDTQTNQATLLDIVQGGGAPTKPNEVSYQTLVAQTDVAISKFQKARQHIASEAAAIQQASGAPVDLKPPVQQLLQDKLTHIDDSLKVAFSKTGVEYNPTQGIEAGSRTNPIERFLGLLTRGQNQLETLGEELGKMGAVGKELSAANMLAVQVKVGQIQQQVELFTAMLSKSLESIKTIMNIQV